MQQMYPNATPYVDYEVRDDGEGQVITKWNLPHPQPTEADFENVWSGIGEKPEVLSYEKRIEELENMVNLLLLGGI